VAKQQGGSACCTDTILLGGFQKSPEIHFIQKLSAERYLFGGAVAAHCVPMVVTDT
jgi:hypothetical protein